MANQPTAPSARPPPDVPAGTDNTLTNYLRSFSLWCRDGFISMMRSDEAHAGVLLQAFNAPPGVSPTVWMLEVGQGGNLHTAQMTPGSGSMGTPIRAGTVGVTDGSVATPGQIGEVISSNVAAASAVPLTITGVSVNITSILLTAGDWDVAAEAWIALVSGAATAARASITTVSATMTADSSLAASRANINLAPTGFSATSTQVLPLRVVRASLAAATTYYLVANMDFTSGTVTAYGNIWARRAR